MVWEQYAMLGHVLIYYVRFDEFFVFYATFYLGNFCKLQKKGRTDPKSLARFGTSDIPGLFIIGQLKAVLDTWTSFDIQLTQYIMNIYLWHFKPAQQIRVHMYKKYILSSFCDGCCVGCIQTALSIPRLIRSNDLFWRKSYLFWRRKWKLWN